MAHHSFGRANSKPRKIELLIRAFQDSRPQDNGDASYYARMEQWRDDVRSVAREQKAANPGFDVEQFLNDCGLPTKATISVGWNTDVDGNK